LQQRSAGVEDSRGPDALAIARVTITWVAAPDDQRIAADCSNNFSTSRLLDFSTSRQPAAHRLKTRLAGAERLHPAMCGGGLPK